MQPYSHIPYQNSVPIPYATPTIYQPPSTSYTTPVYNPYGTIKTSVPPVSYGPQIAGYPQMSNTNHMPIVPAPQVKQPQEDRRKFQNPPAPAYYSNQLGTTQVGLEHQQQFFGNSNANAFLQQPTIYNGLGTYGTIPPISIEPFPLPPTVIQPIMLVQPPIERSSSPTSTCSTCSRSSSPNGRHNCPDCDSEWENERHRNNRDTGN